MQPDSTPASTDLSVGKCPALAGAVALLASAQLPTQDLMDAHCEHFFFAGTGSALVRHAEAYAGQRGVRSLYLLTTTAESFFERRGFARAGRESAPPAIRNTREFAGICPASSAFMSRKL